MIAPATHRKDRADHGGAKQRCPHSRQSRQGAGFSQFGFWVAIATAVVTAISFAIAITTLPISGPFCQAGCVTYPYLEVAAYVPHDYIWMYPATVMTLLFVMLMVCIHHHSLPGKKLYSQIALAFAIISATLLTLDYYVQIATMQPSILRGETEGLALFSQYNPHGIFIALRGTGLPHDEPLLSIRQRGICPGIQARACTALALSDRRPGRFCSIRHSFLDLRQRSRIPFRSGDHHHQLDRADCGKRSTECGVQACGT